MSLFCFLIGPISGSRQYFEQRNRKLGVTNGQRAALSKSAASLCHILYPISHSPCSLFPLYHLGGNV